MRPVLLISLSTLLIAASPASEEALQLMEQGEEARAFLLVEAGAGQGDADSIDYLAWFYDVGRHVPQDRARAAALYRRAADLGQRHAQWRLGVMLDLGDGVAEDEEEAFRWIRLAAERGSPLAAASLGVMYANGRGTPVDYRESMRWYREAARRGAAAGFYGVALLYANGQGVARDRVEGLAWMLVAATLEDQRAQEASQEFNLPHEDTEAAVARANALLREHGLTSHSVRFRNLDREQEQQTSPVV